METIEIITEKLKQNFSFMLSKGYSFKPLEVYNPNNLERIFAQLKMENNGINRELTFTIYPRAITEIEIYVTDCNIDQSMNFKHYIEFKKGNPPEHTQEFVIDKSDMISSVNKISTDIRLLIENDLKDVVFNHEWITFPTYDPRDDY